MLAGERAVSQQLISTQENQCISGYNPVTLKCRIQQTFREAKKIKKSFSDKILKEVYKKSCG